MRFSTFERLRLPAALLLMALLAILIWPRGGEPGTSDPEATPSPTALAVVVGSPGGAIIIETPSPTEAPTPEPTATLTAVPVTPVPAPDTFSATLHACRDLDGSRCRGEFERFPRRATAFVVLVLFEDARAGDTISVTLTGPGTSIAGGPYTLQGGGDGYYYSRIGMGSLDEGTYTLIALRNGSEVARITLRRD